MTSYLRNSIIAAYVSSFILGLMNIGNQNLTLVVFVLNFVMALLLIVVCAKRRNEYDIGSLHLFNVTRLLIKALSYQALILLMMGISFGIYSIMRACGAHDGGLDMFNMVVSKLTLLYFMIVNLYCLCFLSGTGLYRLFHMIPPGV
ncbi:hypothetical protein GLP21_12235 [Photobacterium carnosum]|uniref:Uncharacterized protein n=1 Tax=Photobacterium carnosum TaxID=2023717 RepID=A0A2N4UW44_9GAMM|nr:MULTISPECIES: hypothetical protein [Photobacterium]MCD9475834.1 hypothetical protein [Photobacterium phosphoreum]MCD9485885.1 hypothetical protein [Photobacterium iliopiscarium]MCD9507696.1 hypothetical protein [Photobacterium phosphoreum]MCD9538183.1 hypothetical protein [Photobacterium carnosum]MCD9542987.1 hypothetical protein [Photobacterium carnosum]